MYFVKGAVYSLEKKTNVINDKERLWENSRLKEAEETGHKMQFLTVDWVLSWGEIHYKGLFVVLTMLEYGGMIR